MMAATLTYYAIISADTLLLPLRRQLRIANM